MLALVRDRGSSTGEEGNDMADVKRISVPLDRELERELERARRDLAERTGVRASMGAVASGLLRRAVRAPDNERAT